MRSSVSPNVSGSAGPVEMNVPPVRFSAKWTRNFPRSRASMSCTGFDGEPGASTSPPSASRRGQYVKRSVGSCGPTMRPARAIAARSMTPGLSAVQFQRQLGLPHYETAFQILHKLRAGMVRADRDRIDGVRPKDYVEVDVTWIGGKAHGEVRRVHDQTLVVAAVEVCQQKKPKES